jgi:hypothetical protein
MAITLLVAAAIATAQDVVTLDIVSGPHPGPYVSSATYNTVSEFGPGSQLTLWTVVHTGMALDGIEYRLHVNDDADNDKFDLVGYAVGPLSPLEPVLMYPPGTLSGYGTGFAYSGPPTGFTPADYTKKTMPVGLDNPVNTEAIFSTTSSAENLEGKTLIGYVIEANGLFTAGTYEFSALGSIGTAPTAEWVSTPQAGTITTGNNFILTVLPEPTSVLLLLAAIPFVRRRSAR